MNEFPSVGLSNYYLDPNSRERTVTIVIKSVVIRDALRDIMKASKAVSLQEDKPSVCHPREESISN